MISSWENSWAEFRCRSSSFPVELRKIVYTTNADREPQRGSFRRGGSVNRGPIFPNEQGRGLKVLYPRRQPAAPEPIEP